MIDDVGYVELGLTCADICGALERGMSGRQTGRIGRPVSDAIVQLTT